jgi:hypothetical protein
MIPGTGRTTIGAYVCPAGVFAAECRRGGGSLRIDRAFDVPARLGTAAEAADHLVRALGSAGVERAAIAIALRGFGVVHHVLQLPAARTEILTPIVERELRRLEPQIVDPVVAWTSLATSTAAISAESSAAQLAAAIPADTVRAFEQRLAEAGHTLLHLTALPAAMNHLGEEFDRADDVSALVASLPDGVFLGFFLGAALRLVFEPPRQTGVVEDASALAEEAELGAVFLQQHFRGARLDRATILGAVDSVDDPEQALTARLGVPVTRFALRDLSAAAHVGVGAALDATSGQPFSLGGETRERATRQTRRPIEPASLAASLVALVLAAWTVVGAVEARSAASDFGVARQRLQQDSFGFATARATAEQRRLVRDARSALRLAAADRQRLQQTIVSLAAAIDSHVRVDSMSMSRAGERWDVRLRGAASGASSALAVQALHDFYLELPRRLSVSGLSLDSLSYVDVRPGKESAVNFVVSFAAEPPPAASPAGQP